MSTDRRSLIVRLAAWLCVVLIAYLSLAPHVSRTPAPPGAEHAVAYGTTAILMALAYPLWPVWAITGSLATYSAVMEFLQNFSPGRHPGLDGVVWSSVGAIIGGLSITLTNRFAPRLTEVLRGPGTREH